jgi:cytochrome c-type biogenesis protein CcmH
LKRSTSHYPKARIPDKYPDNSNVLFIDRGGIFSGTTVLLSTIRTTIVLFLLILLTPLAHASITDTYSFASPTDTARFQSLTREVRCVVCQNQSINDSNAPLAIDLREKIYRMVLAKQSNDEIKSWLVKRYGEFILLQPRLNKLTLALWLFPVMALSFIFFALWRHHLKYKL